jgi:hypothetical protein
MGAGGGTLEGCDCFCIAADEDGIFEVPAIVWIYVFAREKFRVWTLYMAFSTLSGKIIAGESI